MGAAQYGAEEEEGGAMSDPERAYDIHAYRKVQTPTGRRIKCSTTDEFLRVTRWVAWLRLRTMERNRKGWQTR